MFDNIRITQRFATVLVAYWLSFMAVAIVSYWGLSSARDSFKTVQAKAMVPALQMSDSIDKIVQNGLQILLAFQHTPEGPLAFIHDHPTGAHTDSITENRLEANRLFDALTATSDMPEEQALLTAAKQTRAAWHDKLDLAVKGVSSGDFNPATMAVFLQAGRTEGEAPSSLWSRDAISRLTFMIGAAAHPYHES